VVEAQRVVAALELASTVMAPWSLGARRRRLPTWPATHLEHAGHVEEEAERKGGEDGVTDGGGGQREVVEVVGHMRKWTQPTFSVHHEDPPHLVFAKRALLHPLVGEDSVQIHLVFFIVALLRKQVGRPPAAPKISGGHLNMYSTTSVHKYIIPLFFKKL
jgi:hypothetical protein